MGRTTGLTGLSFLFIYLFVFFLLFHVGEQNVVDDSKHTRVFVEKAALASTGVILYAKEGPLISGLSM